MLARDSSTVSGFCAKVGDFGLARSFQMQTRIKTRMYGTVRSWALWTWRTPGLLRILKVTEQTAAHPHAGGRAGRRAGGRATEDGGSPAWMHCLLSSSFLTPAVRNAGIPHSTRGAGIRHSEQGKEALTPCLLWSYVIHMSASFLVSDEAGSTRYARQAFSMYT